MIVSKEPPDPVSDHRVEEISEEVELEVTEVQKLAKNYDVGENFNFFSEKVNVDVMDDDGDNDEDDHGDGDNDLNDDNDNDIVVVLSCYLEP